MLPAESNRHTLIIARFNEDVSWIKHVPEQFDIRIFNKGEPLSLVENNTQNIQISREKNVGRESETYIRYLLEAESIEYADGYTVFTQANPFEHSPDFLTLLNNVADWKPIQPLSFYYKKDVVPPPFLLKNNGDNSIGKFRVHLEPFSVYSMDFVKFHDEFSIKLYNSYKKIHNIKAGTNLSEHFLEKCGVAEMAKSAKSNLFGLLNYGAIFGVQNSIIAKIPGNTLTAMHQLTITQYIHGYMFERHWLHIFGYPFFLSQKDIYPG